MNNLFNKIIKINSETVGVRNEIDEITTVALILQKIFGQQVLEPNWTWKRYCIRHLLSVFLFIYVFFGTLQTLRETTDAELIAEACYTLIMIAIFPVKLSLFLNNRYLFRELYVTAKTTLFDAVAADAGTVMKTAKNIVYTLFSMVIIPVTNYEIIVLMNYVNGKMVRLSRSTATLMPMRSPFFEIAWLFHTIFLVEISTTIILDMWFVLLIYFLCASSNSLVKILDVKRDSEESIETYQVHLNDALKQFYRSHIKQVRYLNVLNRMYKWLAFVPLCNAAMCICIILLLLSKELNWKFAPHFLPMFAEIFAYNWFGELIKTKANNVQKALLKFDWSGLLFADRKSYLIIIMYANKEFGVKTAIGNDLSLITMTAVLKASYQAFTVLQSVGD